MLAGQVSGPGAGPTALYLVAQQCPSGSPALCYRDNDYPGHGLDISERQRRNRDTHGKRRGKREIETERQRQNRDTHRETDRHSQTDK